MSLYFSFSSSGASSGVWGAMKGMYEERFFLIALTNIPTDLIGKQVGFVPLVVNRYAVLLEVLAAYVGKGG